LDAASGVIGLSAGDGTDPDFLATDHSELGDGCGPRPPAAISLFLETNPGSPLQFLLEGSDDGLPDPPGELTFVIETLPEMPLRHLATGKLLSAADLPYVIGADLEPLFSYEPVGLWEGEDLFTWYVDDGGLPPEGGASPIASVTILVASGPQDFIAFDMEEDPGWSMEGLWAWGVPQGGGGQYGYPDPTGGATGSNVVGYNLAGDYENNRAERALTTGTLDCSDASNVELVFMRWLNVETSTYDHASIEVSDNDGLTWVQIWENTSEVTDNSWQEVSYDISDVADGSESVKIRWIMGTTDASWQFSGWNVDDVRLRGIVPNDQIPGDLNGDGFVGVDDLLIIIANWGPCGPVCPADINGDGVVGVDDLLIVIANWGPGGRSAPMPGVGGETQEPAPRTPDLVEEVEDDLFINDGLLAPSEHAGLFHVDSDYLQTEQGVLDIELVNTIPIEGHDLLSINGVATLGGGLVVRFGEGCSPRAGDRFGVLVALELQGEFDWIELPQLEDGLMVVPCQQAGVLVLEIRQNNRNPERVPGDPRADVNRDGDVNSNDLHVLVRDWAHGGFHDLDRDGRFSPRDLALVLQQLHDCP
ncbi:MAG: dockerin type I domain-containing protein, partial [Planctomycetota bacterium]|nr:dockerin type I domain-containing protein [Planctomycetota bacterium]